MSDLRIIITGGRTRNHQEDYGTLLEADYHNTLETYPADWEQHGRVAGPIRNQEMADAGADLCLAFPSAGKSAGTWDMIRRACAAGIETRIYPEGKQ